MYSIVVAAARGSLDALPTVDELRGWINSTLRASGASAQEITDQKAEVYAEQQSLRAELEPLDALISLKRQELPQAAHIRAICQQFTKRAAGADAQGKRALLDELEVTVEVEGTHFWIDGVLKDLWGWRATLVYRSKHR